MINCLIGLGEAGTGKINSSFYDGRLIKIVVKLKKHAAIMFKNAVSLK